MTVFEKQLNFLLRFYHNFDAQFNITPSNHLPCIYNVLKQVIDSQYIFLVLLYNDNIQMNCVILFKNDFFFAF